MTVETHSTDELGVLLGEQVGWNVDGQLVLVHFRPGVRLVVDLTDRRFAD